jgi:hypothetical protein
MAGAALDSYAILDGVLGIQGRVKNRKGMQVGAEEQLTAVELRSRFEEWLRGWAGEPPSEVDDDEYDIFGSYR